VADSPGKDEYQEQDAFKAKMLDALKAMKIPEDQLKRVALSDHDSVLGFYAYAAYRFGRAKLPPDKWNEFEAAYYDIVKVQAPKPLSPDQCEKLLQRFHVDTTQFDSYMSDFQHYSATGEQRRPDVWAQRSSWGFGPPNAN
jgi:hypothetical protein